MFGAQENNAFNKKLSSIIAKKGKNVYFRLSSYERFLQALLRLKGITIKDIAIKRYFFVKILLFHFKIFSNHIHFTEMFSKKIFSIHTVI